MEKIIIQSGEGIAFHSGFLIGLLHSGPLPSKDVESAAMQRDLPWSSVQRAKEKLGIVSYRTRGKHPQWFWTLPNGDPEEAGDA